MSTPIIRCALETSDLGVNPTHAVARCLLEAGLPLERFHRGERDRKKGHLSDGVAFDAFLSDVVRQGGLYLSSADLLADITPSVRDRAVRLTLWPKSSNWDEVEAWWRNARGWFPKPCVRWVTTGDFEEAKARNRFAVQVGVSTHEFWLPRTTQKGWLPGPMWRTFWSNRMLSEAGLTSKDLPMQLGVEESEDGVTMHLFEQAEHWRTKMDAVKSALALVDPIVTVRSLAAEVAKIGDESDLRLFKAKYG